MAYYLGIDGGGSKTTCAVGDERSVLATVTGGASNITRVGESGAREALHRVMLEACSAAGITLPQVRRACIGVAGAGREEVAHSVHKIIAEIFSGDIEIVGDMEIAMAAAFETGPGVIVIAGTGSIAYGRDAREKRLALEAGDLRSLMKDRRTGLAARRSKHCCGRRMRLGLSILRLSMRTAIRHGLPGGFSTS